MSARPRISLPAVLLVLGVALSCSTACLTSAVIQSVESTRQYNANLAAAHRQLNQNVSRRSGGTQAAVTLDPASIQRAIRLALPERQPGQPGGNADSVEVETGVSRDGKKLVVITVRGDFGTFYDSAFAEYVEAVRVRIDPRPIFRLKLIRTINGHEYPTLERELE